MNFSSPHLNMAIASFLYSTMGLCVKLLDRLPVVEAAFLSTLLSMVCVYAIMQKQGINYWGKNKKILLIRGGIGAISSLSIMVAARNLPLSISGTLQNLAPIFAPIWGILLLNERIASQQWFFFLLSFSGVAIISKFEQTASLWYLGIGLFGAISSSLIFTIVRKARNEHPFVLAFYLFVMSSVPYGYYAVKDWVTPRPSEWLLIAILAVIGISARYFQAKAYHYGKVGSVTAILYLGVAFSILYDYFFFQQVLTFQRIIGILFVVSGVFFNTFFTYNRK